MPRCELNITYDCQLSCPGCDRLCGKYRCDDQLTAGQVSAMLAEAHERHIHLDRIKVLGGEPLLHPDVCGIIRVLIEEGIERKIVGSVKLDSNGIAPLPDELPKHPQFRVSGRKPKKKSHLPYLWSPSDLGIEWSGPCSHPRVCGFSFDSRGWLPCSPSVMIDRLFYGGEHYRASIPVKPWAVDKLCRHCIYAATSTFREANVKPLREFTAEMKSPTKSWAEALRNAGVDIERTYAP